MVPPTWVLPNPPAAPPGVTTPFVGVSRQEFDELKRDVLEMKALLKRAKEYDERNGEPGCEMEAKMALLRKVAAAVGIDLDDILKPASAATQ